MLNSFALMLVIATLNGEPKYMQFLSPLPVPGNTALFKGKEACETYWESVKQQWADDVASQNLEARGQCVGTDGLVEFVMKTADPAVGSSI